METGLGERLVTSRVARGLALEDVVQVLRLPATTLQALESDCHEKLPAPVFVRGYLRAYARLLEMDGEALVAEYNRLAVTSTPVLTPVPEVRRTAGHDLYLRGAAALLAVAMVTTLGAWWYMRAHQDASAETRSASAEIKPSASSASGTIPSQTISTNPVTDSFAAVAPGTSSRPSADPAAAAEPVPTLVDDSPATANADVAELPVAPLAAERGGLVPASRAPAGEQVIFIKANDESWAEVVDANGYQLLYYLLRPGMEYRLEGQAPFQVFLGNAPAVELSLNEERFDHSPFRRRNSTARFPLDVR